MNEASLSLQGKQLTVFVADDKMQAFKQKLEFGKTCICHWEPDSFPIISDFSEEIGGEINKGNVSLLHNETCPHLEELQTHRTNIFQIYKSMMVHNYVRVKQPFKMSDTPMGFNTTKFTIVASDPVV